MGLLDNLVGQVTQAAGAATAQPQNNLIQALLPLLGGGGLGGIAGLLQLFTSKGLGEIVASWIGTGPNLPISPAQVTHGLGSDLLNQLATKVGQPSDQVASQLSTTLPTLVDKLTPGGQIPTQIPTSMDDVGKLLGGLF